MEIYNGIYDTGEPFIAIETGVNILRNKKNNLSYYNFILQPQKNAGGEIIGIGIIATEVTQVALLNKKIQVSEERFRMLIMQAPIAICVLRSKEYIIETINERMVEMWGRTMEESVNKPVFDVLIEVKNQGFRELLDNVYTTGERFVAEELPISLKRNGKLEIAFVKFIYEPLREADGTITGIMAVAHEITDQVISRKKIEATALLHEEMLMTSPGFICTLVGPDHVYGLINEQYQKLFGNRKIKGKPLMIALPELEGQGLDTILDNVYKTGETFVGIDVPIMLAREENAVLELRYFNFSYQPMYDENKQIYSILVFGYEVTQQEIAKNRIEQSEKQFRLVTDAMPQKITTSDHEGNITFFNHQWINETGYALEELQNGGWQKTIHPDDIEITKNSWVNAIKFETAFEVECRILHKKWGYRWNLSRAVPIKDDNGKVIMWVGTHTDIHDHKEAKSKAESAVLIAEEAVKAKQQFLSNMSHEIRTPMNSIIGFTNVVLKTNLTDKQKEYINAVKVSGESLVVLIDDILDLAKVDAGKMIFEHTPFYLFSSVSDMLHLFETKIQEKNLTLIKQYDTSIPPVVVGDALRLRQIILNLVNNAVKFTTKGTITISIRKRTEDSENVTVEFIVKDTGMGIEEKNLDQIFNSFQQVAFETNRLYGGTGLGLAIVKQLVSLQGGTVKVKSKLGEGSTFSFTLNFKKIKAKFIKENNKTDAPVKKEIASPEYLHKVKILAVEDIDLNQLLIKIMVTDFGFDIDIAANGKIALEYLAKNKYDLILMDLLMPVMNGFEATEMIRKKMKSKIPIIALTADVTTVDLKKCKALGMNDYISKPINEKELLTKITKYLKKSTKKKESA